MGKLKSMRIQRISKTIKFVLNPLTNDIIIFKLSNKQQDNIKITKTTLISRALK